MQFLTSLFGGTENSVLTAVLALGIVLILIVLGLWALKAVFQASNNIGGRSKRLSVVDSTMVDPRRRLIIVRRDNVEHLILTGGPQDLVVETGIPIDKPSATARRGHGEANVTPPAERPAPSYPVTDALQAAQALAVNASPSRGPMEKLRELTRATGDQRKSNSLRHTGLLRPVSRMQPAAVIPINPDNSDNRRVDSAKTGPGTGAGGQGKPGGGNHPGDGAHVEKT
jgi:flagellar protein FliO/FliZ